MVTSIMYKELHFGNLKRRKGNITVVGRGIKLYLKELESWRTKW